MGLLDRLIDVTMDDFEVDLNRLLRNRTHLNIHNRHLLAITFSGLRLIECKGYMSTMSVASCFDDFQA